MGQIQQQVLGAIRSQKTKQVVRDVGRSLDIQENIQDKQDQQLQMIQANQRAAKKLEDKIVAKRISSYLNSKKNKPIEIISGIPLGFGKADGEFTVDPKQLKAKAREYMKQKNFGEYAKNSTYNKPRVANALAFLELQGKRKEQTELMDEINKYNPEAEEYFQEQLRKNPPKED